MKIHPPWFGILASTKLFNAVFARPWYTVNYILYVIQVQFFSNIAKKIVSKNYWSLFRVLTDEAGRDNAGFQLTYIQGASQILDDL